jgi:hypothetical protein
VASLTDSTREWLEAQDDPDRIIDAAVQAGLAHPSQGWVSANDLAAVATDQPPRLPKRPADSASKADWVDYVVALGADRDSVTGQSRHYVGDAPQWPGELDELPDLEAITPGSSEGAYAPAPSLTKAELIELADRTGG